MERLILIADSGSTKTDWGVVGAEGTPYIICTRGLNPFFLPSGEMAAALRAELLPRLPEGHGVGGIHFYGAGCTPEMRPVVAETLRKTLAVEGAVEVESDLLGAARALCGHAAGIAAILGTGSNSCQYDGESIVRQTPALGFILGDEGGGAYLGKRLLSDLLKGVLPAALKERLFSQSNLTQADIIERVYRRLSPNRFLASFAPFIKENIGDPAVERLVVESFEAFIRRNVLAYDTEGLPLHCVGSIAWHFRPQLEKAAAAMGVRLGRVVKSPLEGLIAYHC